MYSNAADADLAGNVCFNPSFLQTKTRICLYLWLMARTTASLQQVLQELLQDEINHMTKFWGFGQWLYSDVKTVSMSKIFDLNHYHKQLYQTQVVTHLTVTINRMMRVLSWQNWSLIHKIELIYTFTAVGQRMWSWSKSLTTEYLNLLFASALIAENDFAQSSILI